MKRFIAGAVGAFLLATAAGAWTIQETGSGEILVAEWLDGKEMELTFHCEGRKFQATLAYERSGKAGEFARVDHELDNGMPAITEWEDAGDHLILDDATRLVLWSRDAGTMTVKAPSGDGKVEARFDFAGFREALGALPCASGVAQ